MGLLILPAVAGCLDRVDAVREVSFHPHDGYAFMLDNRARSDCIEEIEWTFAEVLLDEDKFP